MILWENKEKKKKEKQNLSPNPQIKAKHDKENVYIFCSDF